MSRHEAGLVAASTAAEPLIYIAYFNALFPTSGPSSGQRASRFACNEVKAVYAGEGTPWVRTCGSPALVSWTRPHTFASDWCPASVLPLLGVRKIRRANRGWDWLPVAQAKERFAELNGGNPWEPLLTELTWPKVKSIDVDRLQMKKLRDDALRRGYDALWTQMPTWWSAREAWLAKPIRRVYAGENGLTVSNKNRFKRSLEDILAPGAFWPLISVPAFLYWRPEDMITGRWSGFREAHTRRQDNAPMIQISDHCYVAAARTPTPEPEIRTDLQDEILKLQARGGSLGVIRDAAQARGLQIDDDGASDVLGPAGYMFGDGDPSAAALMDDEVEAFNAGPGRSLPEKVLRRGRRLSYPRYYDQRITFWPSISSFCHAGKYKRAKLWTWTEPQPASETFGTHYSTLAYSKIIESPWSHTVGLIETDASWPSERWPQILHPWFRISYIDTPYVAYGAIVSFAEVATLWNERPKATTSIDAINGYSEDPDWQAKHLRQKAMSAADYDAVAGVGRSVRTGPEPRRLPNGTAKQDERTRAATELIELNPAQSDIPEQQTQCEDSWTAAIRNYAYGRDRVFVDGVARHISKKFDGKFGKKEQLRIGKILVSMGWERWRAKNGRGFVNRRPSPFFSMNNRVSD